MNLHFLFGALFLGVALAGDPTSTTFDIELTKTHPCPDDFFTNLVALYNFNRHSNAALKPFAANKTLKVLTFDRNSGASKEAQKFASEKPKFLKEKYPNHAQQAFTSWRRTETFNKYRSLATGSVLSGLDNHPEYTGGPYTTLTVGEFAAIEKVGIGCYAEVHNQTYQGVNSRGVKVWLVFFYELPDAFKVRLSGTTPKPVTSTRKPTTRVPTTIALTTTATKMEGRGLEIAEMGSDLNSTQTAATTQFPVAQQETTNASSTKVEIRNAEIENLQNTTQSASAQSSATHPPPIEVTTVKVENRNAEIENPQNSTQAANAHSESTNPPPIEVTTVQVESRNAEIETLPNSTQSPVSPPSGAQSSTTRPPPIEVTSAQVESRIDEIENPQNSTQPQISSKPPSAPSSATHPPPIEATTAQIESRNAEAENPPNSTQSPISPPPVAQSSATHPPSPQEAAISQSPTTERVPKGPKHSHT